MNSNQQAALPSLRARGAILLISCYELGQQPLGLVMPNAHLSGAGFAPELMDIDVEAFDERKVTAARLVGLSVPMHTALILGIGVARRIRSINPNCHIVFYGLYALLNSEYLLGTVADSCLGPESERELVELAQALETGRLHEPRAGTQGFNVTRSLSRMREHRRVVPKRGGTPPLDRYTRMLRDDRHHNVGYTLTTRGCKHRCLHCPLTPLYDGRFYALPLDVVLDDVGQLVSAGATHITFADPDFLNGPSHARRVARALHGDFPTLTFDFTAKVEHLLAQKNLLRELRELGCIFVTSAFESLSARTLAALKKGHTPRDLVEAVRFCRSIDLTLRPTFVPFTPWDTLGDYVALLDMVEREEIIDDVDAVQYTIRLLVPPGSPLVESDAMRPHLGQLDEARLTYMWHHPDPRMDILHEKAASLVSSEHRCKEDAAITFFTLKALAQAAITDNRHREPDVEAIQKRFPAGRALPPRLTEDWFC